MTNKEKNSEIKDTRKRAVVALLILCDFEIFKLESELEQYYNARKILRSL